jgi:hypothetical protein
MVKIKTYVEVETQFQGLHNWPECSFKSVSYLKNLHRHLIFVTTRIETKKDRGIEFFMLKDSIDNIIDELYGNEKTKVLGRKSMEEIGSNILNKLIKIYGERYYLIKVSEDNQVRGIVEYDK